MKTPKKAVVLVNLGSPDSPEISDVRSYLKEFLSDPDVIDLPSFFRYLLVHGIIAPIRSFRSSKLYAKLRTKRGFPLVFHSRDLELQVRGLLQDSTDLFLGMRYGKPSLKDLLQDMKKSDYEEIRILPLYPQFATSTTGSVIHLLQSELRGTPLYDRTRIIPQFHHSPEFIELWQKKVLAYNPSDYDAIIFSYHGIPVRQAQKAHPGQSCEDLDCMETYTDANTYCYQAACFQTTRSIVGGLNISPERIYTSFQSRFGRNWLSPHTDQILTGLAEKGQNNVLIISPSFVADCLETIVEIDVEYKLLFEKAGGKRLTLVPSLNADQDWISFIANLASDSYRDAIPLNKWSAGPL